ncbi:hypothetical protein [Sphingobacterium sp. UGAL515B_05]|uniref:hypothetical protein n=1 Tax=Sphingobacterium sp. UGAL515B_05 TaxID=2986767 RepID=UPI002953D0D3|nr:hypothetical protein [Sphingobacterium sp. UGAL515B_05]WON92721.1 hypothetical protein OK025_15885 [Sphingobacterium sp. UGAL515B_05]
MKKIVGSFLLCALALNSFSQDWIPQKRDKNVLFRLLDCQYEGAKLVNSSTIGGRSDNWNVTQEVLKKKGTNEVTYRFTFKAKRAMKDAGVAVAFDAYDWSSDNFVMIPAVVYNGNRQRIVNREYATGLDKTDYYRKDLALTSNPIPQLSPEFGAKSKLEVNISNTSTPVMAYLDRKQQKGVFLFTDQGITWKNEVKDHALIVEESKDRSVASFVVSAPGVRSRKPEFIGFSESPDRGISVAQGDELQIRVTRLEFQSADVPYLYTRFMQERKLHIKEATPRNLMPMSEVFTRMAKNIDERYYAKDGVGFYCPENADWMSYGWVGGLINTYPMLALADTTHFNRVRNTFDFALPKGRGASGYYYDVLGADGKVIYRDGAKLNPGIGLTRKNADVLYWMVKQFMLLKKQGKSSLISKEWENSTRQLADAFVKTWQEEGTWGNYIAVESGKIAAYNTTGGAMAVAGLALAASYFHNDQYLNVAKEAANKYYDEFALVGFTSGACGDILQNADSETAIALTTSLMTLFEQTGKREYLDQAKNLANYTASWTVSFPYQLPENTALAKLGANLTGAVWASTQNKHGAPGFCTQSGDALFKLFRETGTSLYADLIRDVIHAHAEGIQPNGKITERLTYCDADSRGSRGDGGKTGWNETNGALMALEIPGLYVRKDKGTAYAFDHIVIKTIKKTNQGLSLTLYNPTSYDATVTVLAEDAHEAARPLGENAFWDWKNKVNIKAGESVAVDL